MQTGKSKIGRLLLLIGLISLVIFFTVDQSKNPSYEYFCIGLVVAILGGILIVRGQQPPDESRRFRTLRRWREQQRQRKEERKKKPF
jgi:4-amino-4-deoxy-L-arabinose transferase-like glycosyltransferase